MNAEKTRGRHHRHGEEAAGRKRQSGKGRRIAELILHKLRHELEAGKQYSAKAAE